MDEKKPRLAKRGDHHQVFNERGVKAFDDVMSFAQEIHTTVESRGIVSMRSDRLTKFDYLISVKSCAEKNLDRGSLKNFYKLLNGVEIGAGSRRLLIAKLARLFCSYAYGLHPVNRFFCPTDAWKSRVKTKAENIRIAMTPRQPKAFKAISPDNARRFEDNAPLIVAEKLEPQIETPQNELPEIEATDPFLRQDASYALPNAEEVIPYSETVSYVIKTCPSGHKYSVIVGADDQGCFKCAPSEKYGEAWKKIHGSPNSGDTCET